MKVLPYQHTSLVGGAGDVLIDYFINMDEIEGSDDKRVSVLLQLTGKEDDILECVNMIFK